MSKRLNTPLIGVVLLSAFLWGNAYAVKGKYGFSSSDDSNVAGCTFAQTPLPISFTRDDDHTAAEVKFNVFYVKDGVAGMNDYIDFYTSLADHQSAKSTTEEDTQFWPETPYMLKGRDTPVCDEVEECYTDLNHPGVGGYDMGRSRYDTFKNKYTKDELKIAGDIVPPNNGRAYRQYIDVRKIKFLRVEVFTPYTGTDSVHMGYTEPVYFEYNRKPGTNNTLALTSYGSTSSKDKIKPEDLAAMFPKEINTNLIRYIYVYINSLSPSAYQGKIPNVIFYMLSPEQQARLPKICTSS
ncbi:hypothetical protein D782_0529 [Enterobacteriaceae bacterium strain FGI 57]|nr:hypothetical protein D782_0529 [Enterobacteriaceae bacterium strain FGI 57]